MHDVECGDDGKLEMSSRNLPEYYNYKKPLVIWPVWRQRSEPVTSSVRRRIANLSTSVLVG